MTIRIELSAEEEARLKERAKKRGETPEVLAGEMVRSQLAAPDFPSPGVLSPVVDETGSFHEDRWERVMASIQAGSTSTAVLPPEALTREALYSDHD